MHYERYDIYIGRPSIYGNPFRVGIDGTRDNCCDYHKSWLEGTSRTDFFQSERRKVLKNIHKLKGQRIGCYCKPKRCHGDFLAELADRS
jgi:hypothetical protein